MKHKLSLKILHLEDDPLDAEIIQSVMEEEGLKVKIDRVDTEQDFRKLSIHPGYDLILADYSLPDFDGMSALKIVREVSPDIPFIFVSGTLGEELAIESLKNGATDYVLKQSLTRLVPVIYRALEEVAEQVKRKKAEKKFKSSLEEKEILLKEIHHRVKNNLQIISSLLNLQRRSIKDTEFQEKLRTSQDRIRSMAMIHEILYKSQDFAKINFAAYTQSLVNYLIHSHDVYHRKIDIEVKVDDISLDVGRAISCGLIINELVSNSIKHAFKQSKASAAKNKIWVKLHKENNVYVLSVGDNGSGIKGKIELEKIETLGLKLVDSLGKQLEGEVEIIRQPGTRFNIRFAI